MSKRKDISGLRFGRLVATSEYEREKVTGGTVIRWWCTCDCGERKLVRTNSLTSGDTISCGCAEEYRGEWNVTHGKSKTPEYRTWRAMISRCYKETDKQFKHYGGKGISVCDRWHDFGCFIQDMGERPQGMSIDRKYNDKSYCLENCHWATSKEQARNRKGVVLDEDTVSAIKTILCYSNKSRKDIADEIGVSYSAIRHIAQGTRWADISPLPV